MEYKPFDLPAIHICTVRGGKIAAIGGVEPYMSPKFFKKEAE